MGSSGAVFRHGPRFALTIDLIVSGLSNFLALRVSPDLMPDCGMKILPFDTDPGL